MPQNGKEIVDLVEEALEEDRRGAEKTAVLDLLRENPRYGDIYVEFHHLHIQKTLLNVSLITLAFAKLQSDNILAK